MTTTERRHIVREPLPVAAYVPRRTEHLGVVSVRRWNVKVVGVSVSDDLPGQDAVDAALVVAGACLPEGPREPLQAPVGFVLVHRGEEALWVIVGWWELDILHHRLFRADLGSTVLSRVGADGPVGCVWELHVIDHERRAWVEHVLRRPAEPDYDAYLDSVPDGGAASGERVTTTGGMTLERLGAFSDAWGRGDVDELMRFMTDDCVYAASVGPEPGRTYRGRDEVRRGFEELLAHDTGGVSHSGAAFVSGNHGTAEWSYEFTEPDGSTRLVLGCDLFVFRGDKIVVKNAFRKTTA